MGNCMPAGVSPCHVRVRTVVTERRRCSSSFSSPPCLLFPPAVPACSGPQANPVAHPHLAHCGEAAAVTSSLRGHPVPCAVRELRRPTGGDVRQAVCGTQRRLPPSGLVSADALAATLSPPAARHLPIATRPLHALDRPTTPTRATSRRQTRSCLSMRTCCSSMAWTWWVAPASTSPCSCLNATSLLPQCHPALARLPPAISGLVVVELELDRHSTGGHSAVMDLAVAPGRHTIPPAAK